MSAAIAFVVVGDPQEQESFLRSVRPIDGRMPAVVASDPGGPLATAARIVDEDPGVEFVGLVDGHVELAPAGAHRLRQMLGQRGGPDMAFVDAYDEVEGVIRRPDADPERLRCQDYLGGVLLVRRDRVIEGAAAASASSDHRVQRYEFVLRAARDEWSIEHIAEPLVIEHGRRADFDAAQLDEVRVVLEKHMTMSGGGDVVSVGADGVHDTRRRVVGDPLVSIVIPTRGVRSGEPGGHSFPVEAVASIVQVSTYSNIEILLVVDDGADPEVIEEISALGGDRVRFLPWTEEFNFSDKVNLGAIEARGEFTLLLNDDVRVISPEWLESMVALAQLPGAGMVGALLYYEDDSIQHAGHAYWLGDASHIGLDRPRGDAGPADGFRVERRVAGVTAACALMPTDVFLEVGGLASDLPGAFNDVDLCLKVTWSGYRIYWTPHAELYHYESKTRDASVRPFEIETHWGRWAFRMHQPEFWPYELDRAPR